MKINNLKNYFSLNVLAFFGYLFFAFWVYKTMFIIPRTVSTGMLNKEYNEGMFVVVLMLAFLLFLAIMFCVFLFERTLVKRKVIKKHVSKSKLHGFLFYLGLVLYFIPYFYFILFSILAHFKI